MAERQDGRRAAAVRAAVAVVSLLLAASCNSILGIPDGTLTCQSPDCTAGMNAAQERGVSAWQATPAPVSSEPVAPDGAPEPTTSMENGVSGSALPLSGDVVGGSPAASDSPASDSPASSSPPSGGPASDSPGSADGAGGASATATEPPVAAALAAPVGEDGLALPLPDDLIAAPVSGEIVYSDDAQWEVNGVFQPTFEIHTPTASYWIVKPLGTMVSLEDRASNPAQWIAFSSGFRPLRGVPSFAEPPATSVSTLRDQESQTPTHVRLTSESQDHRWQWLWDFYVTHVTFTLNRAPVAFGFAYRGVPGGSLGTEDRLVSSDGTAQGARNSFEADLPGPSEWAYIADTSLGRSLFLLQHSDDDLPEHYQVRDNDSAHWVFGNGQIQTLPIRFSLGLLSSTDHAAVSERVRFVASVIH